MTNIENAVVAMMIEARKLDVKILASDCEALLRVALPLIQNDDFDQAFKSIYEAYSAPADRFVNDTSWAHYLTSKIQKAFGLLQKIRMNK